MRRASPCGTDAWQTRDRRVRVVFATRYRPRADASCDPEAAVDLMLAAMEGYKLRALFEPDLCARRAERRRADELLGLVGIRR